MTRPWRCTGQRPKLLATQRHGPARRRSLQARAAAAAAAEPQELLAWPRVALFWDLDNVRPRSVEQTLVTAHRLRSAVTRLLADAALPAAAAGFAGDMVANSPPHTAEVEELVLYANHVTLASLGGPRTVEAAVKLLPGRLVPVPVRREAADFAMRSDMFHYVERQGGASAAASSSSGTGSDLPACLVCVSSDQGFGPIMRYAASRGFYTVCICAPRRRSFAPDRAYDYAGRQPLAAACHLTLLWSFAEVGAVGEAAGEGDAAGEQELLQRWRAGAIMSGKRGGTAAEREALQPLTAAGGALGSGDSSRELKNGASTAQQRQLLGGGFVGKWLNTNLSQPAWAGAGAARLVPPSQAWQPLEQRRCGGGG